MKSITVMITMLVTLHFSYAQNIKPEPDLANVEYGLHDRNVFDIWFADKSKITPLAIYIHGGGFREGSKERIKANVLEELLESGISVASINYRLLSDAPLPAAHLDAKLALQFIRSKSSEWKIDKNKIGLFGGSAGSQICMWLAFSNDMVNLDSLNPIEHESTRVTCVAPIGGQTTTNREFWKRLATKHLKDEEGSNYIDKLFGDTSKRNRNRMKMYGSKSIEEADKIADELSALSLISADDPPVFMSYFMSPKAKAPSNVKKLRGWLVHHVDFGIALKQKMDEFNIEADLKYPGSKTKYNSLVEFFADKLLEN